jgi:hypothetical protein
MPKPYSDDLRERLIEAVAAGASRREAAEGFNEHRASGRGACGQIVSPASCPAVAMKARLLGIISAELVTEELAACGAPWQVPGGASVSLCGATIKVIPVRRDQRSAASIAAGRQ